MERARPACRGSAEIDEFLGRLRYQRTDEFRGYRNGYLPARTIGTGMGAVEVRQPRVSDVPVNPCRPSMGRSFRPSAPQRIAVGVRVYQGTVECPMVLSLDRWPTSVGR